MLTSVAERNGLAIILLMFSSYGCGLFTNDDPPKKNLIPPAVEAMLDTGAFNTDRFYLFFEAPIVEEIDRLEKRLLDYAKYVRRHDANAISKNDLKFFVDEFFPNQEESLYLGIDTIFTINALFFETGEEIISMQNVEKLFDVFRLFNRYFADINQALKDYESGRLSFEQYREEFRTHLLELSQSIILNLPPNTNNSSARLASIIETLMAWVSNSGAEENNVEHVLANTELIKILIVGGQQDSISLKEIQIIMEKIVDLILPFFDFYYIEEFSFEGPVEYMHFIGDRVQGLFRTLGHEPRSISKHKLSTLIQSVNLPKDFSNAIDIFLKGSILFSGNDSDVLTLVDLKKAFSIFYEGAIIYNDVLIRARKERTRPEDLEEFKRWFIEKSVDFSLIVSNNISYTTNSFVSLSSTSLIGRVVDLLNESTIDKSSLEKISKRTMFLKSLIAGGERVTVSTEDIRTLILKISNLAPVVFDFFYFKEYHFEDNFERTKFTVSKINAFLDIIEEQEGVLFYPDELIDILPEIMGQWTAEDIIHILENYKKFILQEGHRYYTYRNILQGRNILELYFETFILYEQTYKTLGLILDTKTAERKHMEELAKNTLSWRDTAISLLNLELYPDQAQVEAFIQDTWRELKSSELGTKQVLGLLSSKKFQEPTPWKILHKEEIASVINKVPSTLIGVMEIIFNLYRETNLNKKYLYILNSLRDIRKTFYHEVDDTHVFITMTDFDAFRPFFDDALIDLIKVLIPTIKEKILSTFNPVAAASKDDLTFAEFDKMLGLLDDVLVNISLTGPTFDFYKDRLANNKESFSKNFLLNGNPFCPHCHLPRPQKEMDAFSSFTEKQIDSFLDMFIHVTDHYKYFRNYETNIYTYDKFYHRYKEGHIEIVFFRQLIELIVYSYGRDCRYNQSLPIHTVDAFLLDFQPLLEYLNAWTDDPETFGRNIVLLSDLFQHSSNGNNKLDIDEIVEFIGLNITAAKIGNQVFNDLDLACRGSEQNDPKNQQINLPCYRANFFDTFFKESFQLQNSLPRLYDYISSSSYEQKLDFLVSIEGFTRGSIQGPMSKFHVNRLIGAMLNIESTFIRYDQNDDNILDARELENALSTYKNSICLVIGGTSTCSKKMAYSALLSIVKNEKIPTAPMEKVHFLLFHLLGNKQEVFATRVSIGSILYYLAILPRDAHGGPDEMLCQ